MSKALSALSCHQRYEYGGIYLPLEVTVNIFLSFAAASILRHPFTFNVYALGPNTLQSIVTE